jgi:hypothetical protein
MPDTAASMRCTLFGNLESGNVHKVQLILAYRGIPFRRVDVHQTKGQPRDPRFLAINPMGKVPAVLLADGDMISDSGALLFHFAQGTPLWPAATRWQTEVLRWMFFEQYSHEPALAVLRYHLRYTPDPDQHDRRVAELVRARFALDVPISTSPPRTGSPAGRPSPTRPSLFAPGRRMRLAIATGPRCRAGSTISSISRGSCRSIAIPPIDAVVRRLFRRSHARRCAPSPAALMRS